MRALIDTSTFLWTISDNDKLSANARRFIADLENEIFISVASLWEIAIKTSLGKLELLLPFNRLIPEQLEQNSITVLGTRGRGDKGTGTRGRGDKGTSMNLCVSIQLA